MKIDYGKNGLEISINPNWNVTILQPMNQKIITKPIKAIKEAIRNPIGSISLKNIIQKKKKDGNVCIVIDDATRPVPSHLILQALIEKLNNYGVKDENILILIATGLHRSSNDDEIERMVGQKLINRINIKNHQSTDKDSLVFVGKTSTNSPIYLNKFYYESDVKILTGYVEPHFFFGFSGGSKSIVPGIAGAETIQANHSAENIASPYSRFGIYEKNPMAEISNEIAYIAGFDFTINVCINEEHKITRIAAGDLLKIHNHLVDYQLKYIFKEITKPYDIVICGNGGYPLDINLYQAVKSMAIGEMAVKEGGTIISVNECSDGIGVGQDHFKALLFSNLKPIEIYEKIRNHQIIVPDQWEIQILARIMMKAEIFVISKLLENEIGNIGLKYASSVERAIELALNKHGNDASILILPYGPQLLPIVRN
jgi:nickel-dependent lactate racemase